MSLTLFDFIKGDPTPRHTILLNGHEIPVAENLYAMLQNLQSSPELDSGYIKIWIDALCINQNDLVEKGTEVLRMDLIYKEAMAVWAWLGNLPTNSSFHSALSMTRGWLAKTTFVSRQEPPDISSLLPELQGALVTVASEILSLPYWRRVWIMQEVILASSICFKYGSVVFTESDIHLLDCVGAWRGSDLHFWATKRYEVDKGFASTSSMLATLLEGRGASLDPIRLIETVTRGTVSDPRDKVYGILALLPHRMKSTIQPIYSKDYTHWDAYAAFTKSLILDTGDLSIWDELYERSHSSQSEDSTYNLPSWALNLLRADSSSSKSMGSGIFRRLMRLTGHANGKKRQVPSFSHNGRVMYAEGIIVDTIKTITIPTTKSVQDTTGDWYFHLFQTKLGGLEDRFPTQTPADQQSKEALARVIHLDPDYDFASSPSCVLNLAWGLEAMKPPEGENWKEINAIPSRMHSRMANMALPATYAVMYRNADFEILGIPLREYFTSLPGSFRATEYTPHDLAKLFIGRLCMTGAGRVGKVPETAEIGDKIVVLFACNTPVVIRPEGDHYRVVGTCFIDGLMKGEAIEMMDCGELKTEMISFC